MGVDSWVEIILTDTPEHPEGPTERTWWSGSLEGVRFDGIFNDGHCIGEAGSTSNRG